MSDINNGSNDMNVEVLGVVTNPQKFITGVRSFPQSF